MSDYRTVIVCSSSSCIDGFPQSSRPSTHKPLLVPPAASAHGIAARIPRAAPATARTLSSDIDTSATMIWPAAWTKVLRSRDQHGWSSWYRSAAFSASSRLFDLNGETNRARQRQNSAIIVADVRRRASSRSHIRPCIVGCVDGRRCERQMSSRCLLRCTGLTCYLGGPNNAASIASINNFVGNGFWRYATQPASIAALREGSLSLAVMNTTGSSIPERVN